MIRIVLLAISFIYGASNSVSGNINAPFRPGKDYALFFAVSDYENARLQPLPNSIKDAEQIAGVLEADYGFNTEIIKNPSLDDIEDKLYEYQEKFKTGALAKDGQLLIFFSGHGMKEYDNGYFLPADADPDRLLRTALAYDTWRPFIADMDAQHILVAIDACYSVTFDPTWQSKNNPNFQRPGEYNDTEKLLVNHEKYKNRIFFTSDAKEDVVPGRSNFARKFLEGLLDYRNKQEMVTAYELYGRFVKKASPAPRANHFERDEAESSFLFVTEKIAFDVHNAQTREADLNAWKRAQHLNTLAGYQAYLEAHPSGLFMRQAKVVMYEIGDDTEWEIALGPRHHFCLSKLFEGLSKRKICTTSQKENGGAQG